METGKTNFADERGRTAKEKQNFGAIEQEHVTMRLSPICPLISKDCIFRVCDVELK